MASVATRIPPSAHLCQNCGRIIAARTDIEKRDAADDGHEPFGAPI